MSESIRAVSLSSFALQFFKSEYAEPFNKVNKVEGFLVGFLFILIAIKISARLLG